MGYRQGRGRRADRSEAPATSSVPPRTRRTAHAHHHHHQLQQHGPGGSVGVYNRHLSSPTYVTPSAHLALPVQHRSRGTTVMAAKPYAAVTSQHGGGSGRAGVARHVSPSHFSWPGASFELQAGGLADDEEGRSSGGTQGAAEPTSPSLPSSSEARRLSCPVVAVVDGVVVVQSTFFHVHGHQRLHSASSPSQRRDHNKR